MPPPSQVYLSLLLFFNMVIFSYINPFALFQVEIEIGEKRVISFNGTGLSVGPEISFDEIAASRDNPDEVCLIIKILKSVR